MVLLLLLAVELEFSKILVPRLSQHTSNVNIKPLMQVCLSMDDLFLPPGIKGLNVPEVRMVKATVFFI